MITAKDRVVQRRRTVAEEQTEVILNWIRTSEVDSGDLDRTELDPKHGKWKNRRKYGTPVRR